MEFWPLALIQRTSYFFRKFHPYSIIFTYYTIYNMHCVVIIKGMMKVIVAILLLTTILQAASSGPVSLVKTVYTNIGCFKYPATHKSELEKNKSELPDTNIANQQNVRYKGGHKVIMMKEITGEIHWKEADDDK